MLGFPSVTQVRMKSVSEIQLEGLETVFTTQSVKLSVDSTSSIKNGKKAKKPSGIPHGVLLIKCLTLPTRLVSFHG